MKNQIINLFFLLSVVFGCGQDQSGSSLNQKTDKTSFRPLFINVLSATAVNGKVEKTVELKEIKDQYFEISLTIQSDHFIATKDLESYSKLEKVEIKSISVVNEKGELQHFTNPTEFLNYMYERGFELKDQFKKRYGFDYTFKSR
ncbi:MAG: hypothetical protein K9H61_02330 [Bacteroidia bacterium]|nr:hypothetical protein [Bacteroidia bacterium]MCF8427163.1 hypothetical protein [Bacteroidia bacterium]MCF8445808.1 hypothetical protein [Bacteroidia bacterium]